MITLELTEDQARTLLTVLYRVGGARDGRRIYTDDVIGQLTDAGIDEPFANAFDERVSGQLYFRESDGSNLPDDFVSLINSIRKQH